MWRWRLASFHIENKIRYRLLAKWLDKTIENDSKNASIHPNNVRQKHFQSKDWLEWVAVKFDRFSLRGIHLPEYGYYGSTLYILFKKRGALNARIWQCLVQLRLYPYRVQVVVNDNIEKSTFLGLWEMVSSFPELVGTHSHISKTGWLVLLVA